MLAASRCTVYPATCNPLDIQKTWEQAGQDSSFLQMSSAEDTIRHIS